MQHWLEGQSAFVVHDWWLEQASNGPQWQALRSACTQQLHAPPGGCPWQPIVKLHGVFRSHPQGSFTHPPYAANAGVLMLVRIGAVQATAAPAPIRLSIFRREIPLAEASFRGSSGLIRSLPSLSHRIPGGTMSVVRRICRMHHPEGVTFLPPEGSLSTVAEAAEGAPVRGSVVDCSRCSRSSAFIVPGDRSHPLWCNAGLMQTVESVRSLGPGPRENLPLRDDAAQWPVRRFFAPEPERLMDAWRR